MEELGNVALSHGLLTGTGIDSGVEVALPVQSPIIAARVPIEYDLAAGTEVNLQLCRAGDRDKFRFELEGEAVSAVVIDDSSIDRPHRFFKGRPVRVCLGGQTYRAKTSKLRGGHSLEVTIPGRGADLFHAMALLRRSHPRGLPRAGVIIAAKFADPASQTRVLEAAKDKLDNSDDQTGLDPWSPAWHEPPGLVVGALCVGRLFHGTPKGRSDLAMGMGVQLPEGIGQEAVKELALVWVSRIAVDAPYRHCGIGQVLLELLREAIGATLPWQPRAIEVMQSLPAATADQGSSFFLDADYHFARSTYTAPARMLDPTGRLASKLTPLRTLYYWAPVDPPP